MLLAALPRTWSRGFRVQDRDMQREHGRAPCASLPPTLSATQLPVGVRTDTKCRLATHLMTVFGVLLISLSATPSLGASAGRLAVQRSLGHMEERLNGLVEAGGLRQQVPVLVASILSASPEYKDWFFAHALRSLVDVFGPENIRVCHACMGTDVNQTPGQLEWRSTAWDASELSAADQKLRKQGEPAKIAMYIAEDRQVVSVRVVSLANATVLFASNFDPTLNELRRSETFRRHHIELKNRENRAGHMHLQWDGILYPNQHLALDVLDQFGNSNEHLAGLSMSLLTPLAGIGFAYHYVFQEAWNISLGTKVLFALPNVVLNALTDEPVELVDPVLNTIFIVRVPIPETHFAVSGMIATGTDAFPFPTKFPTLGLGVTLLNPSLIPVLP